MDKNAPKTATTRVFKSGNSQAVRIPAELAFENVEGDFTITRSGDTITVRPKRVSAADMVAALRTLPPESKFEPLERTQSRETDWDR